MKIQQLELFKRDVRVRKIITYGSLTICEKINYKANECGLHVVLKSLYNYNVAPLFQPNLDCLTEKYRWHHKVNSGLENRLDSFTNILKLKL